MTATVRDARVVITGATSGIDKAVALELLRQGARSTIVCRDEQKGASTVAELRAAVPDASVEIVLGDLADLAAVRRAGAELVERYEAIDVLINNAGVNDTQSSRTVDGFDHMMASNYLGPYLLNGSRHPHAVCQHSGRGRSAHRAARHRSDPRRSHRPLLHHHARHGTAPARPGHGRPGTPTPHLGPDRAPGRAGPRWLTGRAESSDTRPHRRSMVDAPAER